MQPIHCIRRILNKQEEPSRIKFEREKVTFFFLSSQFTFTNEVCEQREPHRVSWEHVVAAGSHIVDRQTNAGENIPGAFELITKAAVTLLN